MGTTPLLVLRLWGPRYKGRTHHGRSPGRQAGATSASAGNPGIVEGVDRRAQTKDALLGAEQHLLTVHADLVDSPASGVEGLDGASCSGHITVLARLAMGACAEGISADEWRAWVREDLGDRGETVLLTAEQCMRASGLWPWPG